MDNLLNNPFVQSAIVPFIVSLFVAVLLRPHGWVWAGLSAVLGFLATVYLLTGFEFFPLRSHRKILLLGCGAIVLGLLLDALPWRKFIFVLLFVAAAGSTVWLLWPRYRYVDGAEFWALFVGGAVYAGWLVVACQDLRNKPVQADGAVFALALGTGVTALLGATALYGQLASAIAAAVGARLLMHALGKPLSAGSVMVVPLVLVCALLGIGAVAYAKLPWYNLALLALVPALVRISLPGSLPRLLYLVASVALAMLPAVVAMFLTWRETGAPPI